MQKTECVVIFDMDGTMIDNMHIHNLAWKELFDHLKMPMSLEDIKKNIHGKNDDIFKRLLTNVSDKQIKAWSDFKESLYRKLYEPQIKLVDGLEQFIIDLRQHNIKIAIGTMAPVENLNFVLDCLNIRHLFDYYLHAEDVVYGKPHPEIFLKIADYFNVAPERVVVFEDSPTGAKAAQAAQMKTIIVDTYYPHNAFENITYIECFVKNFLQLNAQTVLNLLQDKK